MNLHYKYWLGILTALLVYSLTYQFTENEKVVDYINFASTLASLILAVLAIIYSMITNNEFNQSIGKIETSSSTMIKVGEQINSIIRNLDGVIQTVPQSMSSLEKKLDDISLNSKTPEVVKETPKQKKPHWSKENVNYFLEVNSFTGCIFAYACYLSWKTQKPFASENIGISKHSEEYVKGFFVATNSADLITGDRTDNIYLIKQCTEYFSGAKDIAQAMATRRSLKNAEEGIAKCEAHFGI